MYYKDVVLVMYLHKCVFAYLKSTFLFDFITVFPFFFYMDFLVVVKLLRIAKTNSYIRRLTELQEMSIQAVY